MCGGQQWSGVYQKWFKPCLQTLWFCVFGSKGRISWSCCESEVFRAAFLASAVFGTQKQVFLEYSFDIRDKPTHEKEMLVNKLTALSRDTC